MLLPCYWGLLLGSGPALFPSLKLLSLFTLGAFSARSAGCIINDIADRDIDKYVERTLARPLTTSELSLSQAMFFLSGLMAVNFTILFTLPSDCIRYGLLVTPLVFIYPTAKRFLKVPQLILGLSFNSGIFIGYAASSLAGLNMAICLPFYVGGICWTLVYDTIYAFQDRAHDKRLGLNSAAIAFEKHPRLILGGISLLSMGSFLIGGLAAGLGPGYFAGLMAVAAHYGWQIYKLDIDNSKRCG